VIANHDHPSPGMSRGWASRANDIEGAYSVYSPLVRNIDYKIYNGDSFSNTLTLITEKALH